MRIVAVPLGMVIMLSFLIFSNPVLLAHTFSENENALFLTMINKIKAETQLAAYNFSNNTKQAQYHANAAEALFIQNDPVVNTTWTSEISERNPRITTDLVHSLNDLKTTLTSSSYNSKTIQSKVTNIVNLLDEAVSVRIGKDLLDNPKTQALVLANLANEIYNSYGNALALPSNIVANMAGMSMSSKGSNSGNGSAMNAMNQSPATIKNLTAYQTAESLAAVAQQVFDKNLKPIATANATNSNSNVANYLNQLKNAINNKSSFMNVMELIHIKLHPTLISAYNLRSSMPANMSTKVSSTDMNTGKANGMLGMYTPINGLNSK